MLETGFEPFMVHTEEMPQLNRNLAQETTVTRYGRIVKPSQEAIASQMLDGEDTLTHNLAYNFDCESDIFAIFSAAEESEELKMMHVSFYIMVWILGINFLTFNQISLHDNTTGELLRKIPINVSLRGSIFKAECKLILDGVNIFAGVRNESFTHGRLLSLVEVFS